MKKFCKVIAFTAGIFMAVGVLMIISAFIVSSRSDAFIGSTVFTFSEEESAEIRNIRSMTEYGKTVFKEGDKWSVSFNNAYLKGAECSVGDDTLYVNAKAPGQLELFGWNIGLFYDFVIGKSPETVITYPAGCRLERVSAEGGIGRFSIDSMYADSLLVQAPLGKTEMRSSTVFRNLILDSVIGDLKADDCNISVMTVDYRIGRKNINGYSTFSTYSGADPVEDVR